MQNNLENKPFAYGDDNQYNQIGGNKQLDKSQKIAVAVLAIFAVFIFVFWIVDAKKGLKGDSNPSQNTQNINTETCKDGSCNSSAIDLKLKDTDKDGLNDYDELNLYGTSPYLEDSDSDGYLDSEEVKSSNDPNCPVGRSCTSLNQNNQTKVNQVENPVIQNANDQSGQQILEGQGSADNIRKLLLESSSIDPELLKQISDEELMKTYKDVLGG